MVSEQRVALVIGNAAYASGPLRNPVNDARAMATALRGCRFEVIEKLNVNGRETRRAIRAFADRIKAGGVGLFCYAGHGLQVNGENYLVPIGAEMWYEDEVDDGCVPTGAYCVAARGPNLPAPQVAADGSVAAPILGSTASGSDVRGDIL
jgi:uncharacterized caspase-like protein